jgi:hypothetical protein
MLVLVLKCRKIEGKSFFAPKNFKKTVMCGKSLEYCELNEEIPTLYRLLLFVKKMVFREKSFC